jgi:hypothetical protein
MRYRKKDLEQEIGREERGHPGVLIKLNRIIPISARKLALRYMHRLVF